MRDQCQSVGLEYYEDVRSNAQVYMDDPRHAATLNQRQQWALAVSDLVADPRTRWQTVVLRPAARGIVPVLANSNSNAVSNPESDIGKAWNL
jgi:hypothetical protein